MPYLAALRYKDSGLRKRAEWEHVWDAAAAGGRRARRGHERTTRDQIPVPPKYTSADFVKTAYWSHRGKLDVPKERFISYPGAGRDTDPTPAARLGRLGPRPAGPRPGPHHHRPLCRVVRPPVLTPLVAGVAELLPWIKQWHSSPDPELGIDLAEYLDAQVDAWTDLIGLPRQDLPDWRPPKATRGRRAAATHRRTQTVG